LPSREQALEDAGKWGAPLEDLPAYAVALAAALSGESPFVHIDSLGSSSEGGADAEAKTRRGAAAVAHAALRNPLSDALSSLAALLAWQLAGASDSFARCAPTWKTRDFHVIALVYRLGAGSWLAPLIPSPGVLPRGRHVIVTWQLSFTGPEGGSWP
jgi:hypothetical protein